MRGAPDAFFAAPIILHGGLICRRRRSSILTDKCCSARPFRSWAEERSISLVYGEFGVTHVQTAA
eukprot:SAG31_NODE_20456_length_574_cov_0.545263_1_plen_64_part_10